MPEDTRYGPGDAAALREAVKRAVETTPLTDIHTHLYAPEFGELLLHGMDELLTYHYLIAETLRTRVMSAKDFYALDKQAQADVVWRELFVKRSPVSEACRGVLTALRMLGLDPGERDLHAHRAYFAGLDVERHVEQVFERAGVETVVMTNDPFDAAERAVWEDGYSAEGRFRAALRIDPLLMAWHNTCTLLQEWGYDVEYGINARTAAEVRRFLKEWARRMNAVYMAVSLPPSFCYPEEDCEYEEEEDRARLISECVLPAAEELGIPFAMMIGVRREVNPAHRLAGDGVGEGDVGAVERLCAYFPNNKFMATMLARENQHALCVAARKFPNLCLFGCWWFLNNPSLIEEMTRMRLELLGLSVVPQHSDARVLEQLLYKWSHSRRILGAVLADKYADLVETGWNVTDSEIQRDVRRLLHDEFWDFVS